MRSGGRIDVGVEGWKVRIVIERWEGLILVIFF